MSFFVIVILLSSIGLCLSIGTHIIWIATGRMMLAVGAIALICEYCAALSANAGLPSFVCYGIAALAGVGMGLLVTMLAYRLSIDQFLLLALALSELVRRLAYHLGHITGGAYGLRVSASWDMHGPVFYSSLGILLFICCLLMQIAANRSLGLRWRIIGASRQAGVLIGLNPNRIALFAGAFVGLAAAVAGSLQADGLRYVHPDDLGTSVSLPALAIGISSRPDSLTLDIFLLVFILFIFPDLLRLIDLGGSIRFAIRDIILGMFLIMSAIRLQKGHYGA